jgi:hypothetical protein
MRFLRLRLRHFRGVEQAEVSFRPTGVTVIAGPNEIGKSSLAEAVDLLFDYLDSSSAQAVRAVQPVDRDEGSEVELEFEAGPYRATYLKSFNRAKRTELTVHAPRPESLTGRTAHERVEEILGETVDLGLWKALRIQQETPLSYPDLDGHRSLAAALDRAAGQARSGDAEASLYEAARTEYEIYHTPGGQPRAPLRDAAAAVERAAAAVAELETAMRSVERDVEASARLDRQIAEGEAQLLPLRRTAAVREEDLARLEKQERELEGLESRLAAAESAHREVVLRREGRREMVARVEKARTSRLELEEAITVRAPEISRKREQEARTRAALEAAGEQARQAVANAELAERDLAFRRGELDHDQLSERLERVRDAESRAEEAEAVLESNPVTAELLEEVRAGHLAVERARAAAEAGSPRLLVEALDELTLGTGEGERRLPAGERWEVRVHEATEVMVGDLARLRVEPAAGSRGPVEALRLAEVRYAALLERAGADDLEGAVRRERERSEAERSVAARDRILKENLRDLSRSQLEQKVARLAERIARYPEERGAATPLPASFDEAQERVRESRSNGEAAARSREEAAAAYEQARAALATVEKARDEDGARLSQQSAQLSAEEEALARAREEAPDEEIESAVERAAAAVARVGGEVEAARKSIAAANPEGIRLHAANARAAVEAAERRLAEAREARIAARARLEAAGEKGLDESLAGARIALHRARQGQRSVERRAAAARLLFETLREKRDRARRGYVRPLTERIEGLGRHVFGPDFRVELDESLAVSHRTLHGRTVPFEGLSGGAREQVSILARLACALTVAGDGGVPLIFDDALGNSDAGRLEALGAVMALAGRSCQVVVLTCAPERYRHVGTAELVTLNGAAGE